MSVEFELKTATAHPDRLARIEERLARIEAQLGLDATAATMAETGTSAAARATTPEEARDTAQLEFEVGQNWFAVAGVIALTIGGGFMLSLPYSSLPAAAPALAGYFAVAALMAIAHWRARRLGPLAGYMCGAAMVLLIFSTLRLCLPVSHRALDIDAGFARALFAAAVACNLWSAFRQKSPWLTGIALATGALTVSVAGAHWFAFGGLVLLAIVGVFVAGKEDWRALALAIIVGGYATYLAVTLGPLLRGMPLSFAGSPLAAPLNLLSCTIVFASGVWLQPTEEAENTWGSVLAFVNCGLGYGVFFVHTVAAFPASLAWMHATAFAVFLGIATAFWLKHQSRGATFFYAMTGYAALSVAILKATSAPAVFVWLSLQSVVVVATAVWFRSRLIVVANFLIYVGIVLAYVIVAGQENGISIGFGIVALVSARILNWQKNRLELKTELMRNAYLVSAFLVFPYALSHLVPRSLVGLAWVGLAAAYYGLNLMVRSPKYRWMGHATLVLTMLYVLMVGTREFEPVYRVLSFLALGAMLLIVSLSFTRARRGNAEKQPQA